MVLRKGNGLAAESLFQAYCLSHNIEVSKVASENYPYDFVINMNNKLQKVQVKSAYTKSRFSKVLNVRKAADARYDKIDFDILVGVDRENHRYFFIPMNKLLNKNNVITYVNLNNPKWQQYEVTNAERNSTKSSNKKFSRKTRSKSIANKSVSNRKTRQASINKKR